MPRLLLALSILAFLLGVLSPSPAQGQEAPPPPRFDRVDHARPEALLDLSESLGDTRRLRVLAEQLAGEDAAATLGKIGHWMERNLRQDAAKDATWRPVDEMMREGTWGSCADHSVLFGALARAAGIPTVWVKTMDVDWIRAFREGTAGTYVGHVFLEVHVDGRWQLLDAQAMRLYDPYDPSARILPGNRFAYDKGADPYALVLSCRWELWKQQTDAYFADLDLALVPYARSRDLFAPWRVHVAGNHPAYGWAASAARAVGYRVERTFNTAWDRNLAAARGEVLIVLTDGGEPVLPAAHREALLPPGAADALAGRASPPGGFLRHELADGTVVLLVLAEDSQGIRLAVTRGLRP